MAIKKEILDKLREAHDKVKNHPFRDSLDTRYCKSYKDALYDMSEVWGEIIYNSKFDTEYEAKRYYAFGGWIHNYRARLQMYYPYTFPMSLLDYYEQMLQVTHEYLDTGNIDRYYSLVDVEKDGERIWIIERYEWITEESICIKSKILPRYLPVKHKLVVDEDKIKDCINSGYNAVYESQEQRDKWFEFWKAETKPVIEKLNEKNHDRYTHKVFRSAIYTPSQNIVD